MSRLLVFSPHSKGLQAPGLRFLDFDVPSFGFGASVLGLRVSGIEYGGISRGFAHTATRKEEGGGKERERWQ